MLWRATRCVFGRRRQRAHSHRLIMNSVCKTCLDCGNKCLGYSEPSQAQPPSRSQSQSQPRPQPQQPSQSQSQSQSSHISQSPIPRSDVQNPGPHRSPTVQFPVPSKHALEKSPTNTYNENVLPKNAFVPPATPKREKDVEAGSGGSPESSESEKPLF